MYRLVTQVRNVAFVGYAADSGPPVLLLTMQSPDVVDVDSDKS